MHPEPQVRMSPHVHFKDVAAPLGELSQPVLGLRGRRFYGMLVNHAKAAAAQRQRKQGNDARPGS